ncbi:MAG: cupredoxin domain-containing protein [Deltaproteobacteria bacterium]|nr:cupredoxin domain-containing protein [Deltaproteobacteria bacterium]MCW5808112.1 cupredoxin domain-containing protein [Deltaproteobacteria bacterium]
MLRSAALALALVFVGSACTKADPAEAKDKKEDKPAPPPKDDKGGVAKTADGARKVAIEANKEGYVPAEIVGKPGEKLVLVFTRTVKGECLARVKTPDGKVVELPMNTPVEVPVTVPQGGEVRFACDMDMFFGKIIAKS